MGQRFVMAQDLEERVEPGHLCASNLSLDGARTPKAEIAEASHK